MNIAEQCEVQKSSEIKKIDYLKLNKIIRAKSKQGGREHR